MALRNHLQSGLPRRVVVCYLFFCMAAVCWLTVGVVFTTWSVVSARTEQSILSRLGQTAAAIEIDYVRHQEENLQEFVDRLKSEGRLAYCAVVSSEGRFLAHTSPALVGKAAVAPEGDRAHWGGVEGVSFVDGQKRTMREFRVPLEIDHRPIGSLRAAVIEPGLWSTVRQVAEFAPLAVLAPLLLVTAGAVVLARQAGPLASLEAELRRIARAPLGETATPHSLKPRSAAALGWNRVVAALDEARRQESGDDPTERLARLLDRGAPGDDAAVWRQLPDGVAVADGAGVITQANNAMAALLGKGADVDTLVGSRLEVELAQLDAEALEPFTALEHAQRLIVAELATDAGGAARTLRVARQPLRSEGADAERFLWTVRDITQQKLADQMRSQFMDAATHELRTPLANIKAYAETLASMDEPDLESQKEFCNTINSEATRLARFVDDMLSISSMEVGSLSIERQNVDPRRLIDEIVEKMRPLVRQKSLTFDVDTPAKMPEVQLDKDKMSAVLINLLGNAVKYTPPQGRVALRVKFTETHMLIDVEDTGMGISEAELPRVFEKFFRSSDPRVLEQSGTGLGLSLAREVVRLHGGDITVQSQVDRGSTFSVTIPLRKR
ncbi:MAG: PAS domain-containing protein [Planctomycetales bacterium]|nr:PAS domain-containing protein [Planctomycetales bacterium]